MTTNPPVVKLCLNCRHFVSGTCEHPSNLKFSYVDGKIGTQNTARYLRETERHPDGTVLCGGSGRFHERAPDPNAYADAMIRGDLQTRHEGRAEDFGVSACGRSDRAGS